MQNESHCFKLHQSIWRLNGSKMKLELSIRPLDNFTWTVFVCLNQLLMKRSSFVFNFSSSHVTLNTLQAREWNVKRNIENFHGFSFQPLNCCCRFHGSKTKRQNEFHWTCTLPNFRGLFTVSERSITNVAGSITQSPPKKPGCWNLSRLKAKTFVGNDRLL